MAQNHIYKCMFCGKSAEQATKKILVRSIVEGQETAICYECTKKVMNFFQENFKTKEKEDTIKYFPKLLKEKLDEYIIGQENAKKILSVAVTNHYKKQKINQTEGVNLKKSNIIMIGPTGSGKTLLAHTLSDLLDVPFAIADATTFTEAGYVGSDVESVLGSLLYNANYDVKAAQKGIIYIDEIDKISKKGDNNSTSRDVSGEGVQNALLKMIEGSTMNVTVESGISNEQKIFSIDTSNILFILGGAFPGIDKLVKERTNTKSLGFVPQHKEKKEDQSENIITDDLVKYGFSSEFVGRTPIVVTLDSLSEEDLIRILTEPKDAIVKEYQKILKFDNIDLEFEKDALRYIADEAMKKNTGARGLRAILECFMTDIIFNTNEMKDGEKIVITKKIIKDSFSNLL